MDMAQVPGFTTFAIFSFALTLNLMFLSAFTGAVRARTHTPAISDDAKMVGAQSTGAIPEELQRVLNAHRNALENIGPFLPMSLAYTLSGVPAHFVAIFMGIFSLGRWAHSLFYLQAMQPYRTISYGISTLAFVGMLIHLLMHVLG